MTTENEKLPTSDPRGILLTAHEEWMNLTGEFPSITPDKFRDYKDRQINMLNRLENQWGETVAYGVQIPPQVISDMEHLFQQIHEAESDPITRTGVGLLILAKDTEGKETTIFELVARLFDPPQTE